MKKIKKEVLDLIFLKLEQYYSTMNDPRPENDTIEIDNDVPNVLDDRQFNTFVPLEDKEIPNPVIKTKKGKNVFSDPVEPEDSEIEDIYVFDRKGNEIDSKDVKFANFDDLYNINSKEKVSDLDENFLFEQEDEDENEMGKIAQDNMGEQNPESGMDPNMGQDPSQLMSGNNYPQNQQMVDPSMQGQDPSMGMGGMGMQPPELSAENVGRVFELKKIYARLLSIDSQLSFSSDSILLKLRRFINKAIELFETVISNIESYRKNIDQIIVMYYQFLEDVYSIMKRYYQSKEKKDKLE